ARDPRGRPAPWVAPAGGAADAGAAAPAAAYAQRARRLGLDAETARAAVEEALRAAYRTR
ncbi:GntR family transcriptional regulator, partial [Streptomyces albidoflavus]